MKRKAKIFTLILAMVLIIYSAAGCAAAAVPSAAASYAPAELAPATYAPAASQAAATSYADGAPGQNESFFDSNKNRSYNHTHKPYDTSSEEYGQYTENKFMSPAENPFSTFSIDVDTASYSNIRRYIEDGMLPPEDAVRVEECVNYFSYDYAEPSGSPVSAGVTISDCPWNKGRYLARVSVKAKNISSNETPVSNLVFLIDVSGSMGERDKLAMVKRTIKKLTKNIGYSDRVSIVTYSNSARVALEGCSSENKDVILRTIDNLDAGGSTAGGDGIQLAYETAEKYFLSGGNNRVILCTDGDFNVGISSSDELDYFISDKSKSGVFLTVLGYGTGNVKDNRMETLADEGNGNYAYIDSMEEAEKVVGEDLFSTLYTVAKDVKLQVEFNPDAVKEYRLVGYDNRILNDEDFNDDKEDAGEVGAGHCVTAFYELILVNSPENSDNIDDLVFQSSSPQIKEPAKDWMYVKVRYKQPDSDVSQLITRMAGTTDYTKNPDSDFRFASAVAEFALLLKNSEYSGSASFKNLIARAANSLGKDEGGYRSEFLQLAAAASNLKG